MRVFRFGVHCAPSPATADPTEPGGDPANFGEAIGWAYRKLSGSPRFKPYKSGAEPLPGVSEDRFRRTFLVPEADLPLLRKWLPGASVSVTASGATILTVDADDPRTPWMERSKGWDRPSSADDTVSGEPDKPGPRLTFEARWASVVRKAGKG